MAKAFDYSKSYRLAERLIEKYGHQVTWRCVHDVVPADPEQPWNQGESSYTDYNVIMAFVHVDRQNYKNLQMMYRSEVETGFIKAYMKGITEFVPSMKDVVIRGDEIYRIQYVDLIQPTELKILYETVLQR